jgi:hypothetical protein
MSLFNYLSQFKSKPKKHFANLYFNYLFAFLPIGLIMAFLSVFGILPVELNNEEYLGFVGFLFCLFYIPIAALILSTINWVFYQIGYWILNLIIN